MTVPDINTIQKTIRARIIAAHLKEAGLPPKVVCFSCGNSIKHLQREGLQVVYVGSKGALQPGTWFSYTDVAFAFNGLFDATSGHLPWPLMVRIAAELHRHLTHVYDWPFDGLTEAVKIPTGSGETLVCLQLAFPRMRFIPVYGTEGSPTEYNEGAPLNVLVKLLTSPVSLPRQ